MENKSIATSASEKDNHEVKRPRVLVADDELNIRRAMLFILKSEFDVTIVERGDKAIAQIRHGKDFDVVSLDLQMPGLSGLETLKEMKQLSPTTEVLIVTAHSDMESAKGALKLGAYDYIDKPFKNEEYRAAIRKGVERRNRVLGAEKAIEQLAFVKAQLIQSDKFSAIGQLIAGVVHELNNPLATIMGLSELLLMTECSPEASRSNIEKINKSALLCKNVIQKLLAFSREHESKREYIQVNPIIESTLELKQHDFKVDDIQVITQLGEHMPFTMADFYELQQVFLNIINNAHHAMKKDGGIGVLTVRSEFDDNIIRISFIDTGPGIPNENLQKIFEPLFTTKKRGEGTGLGLSVCFEIIKEHEGNIFVASELGKGTCFNIELPIVARTSQTTGSPHEEYSEPEGQNILVLDGEKEGGALLKKMISASGHQADLIHDAAKAKKKLKELSYDIIISSLNMPGLTGLKLSEYVRLVKPELLERMIFIIDGVISDEMKRYLADSRTPYIIKPFGIQDIQNAIHRVMEASSYECYPN